MIADLFPRPRASTTTAPKQASAPLRALRVPRLSVMHIGKYYPPYRGGMETHLQSLSDELNGMVNLKVIVSNTGHRTVEEEVEGVDVTRVGKLFDFRSAPICPDLVRKIRATEADLVHIHWPNPTAVLAYLASGHRGRLIVSYHSDIVRQKMLAAGFTPILRHALSKAAAIIASSPNYVDSSKILSEFRSKCRVIPYGISVDHFNQYDLKKVRKIQERYGPRIVLSVGRMVYYKGFEHLVRAMARVNAHLLIIGHGPLREHLGQVALELKVSDRVTFLNEVDDVRPYYHAADLFALPSIVRSEAFGIVQIEAMACGKPVINTRLDSGVPFVSLHDISGLTVPPADPLALSDAINELLDDTDRSIDFGIRGRQRVAQKFTIEKMVYDTYDLYHDVMNGKPIGTVDS
jgi:glycosyltransferase involved in cell wall biosynthesis